MDRLAWGALAAVIVGAPHLVAGVTPWAMVAIAMTALASLTLTALATPSEGRWVSGGHWLAIALVGWTWVQGWFLPCDWVSFIDAAAVEQAREAWSSFNTGAISQCALSLDPGQTRVEVLKCSALLSVLLAVRLRVVAGYGSSVLSLVGVCGVGIGLSVCAHWLVGAQAVYGVYTPTSQHVTAALGPILNPNNLGGMLLLAGAVQAGLAFRSPAPLVGAVWGGAAALCWAVLVASGSRGALGALGLLLVLLAAAAVGGLRGRGRGSSSGRARRARGSRSRKVVVCWIALGAVVVYVGLAGVLLQDLDGGAAAGSTSKIGDWALSWPLVGQRPLFGIGRGAFGVAYSALSQADARFVYVENFLLQWAIEWGVPAAIGLSVLVGVVVTRQLMPMRLSLRYCAAAGALCLFVQNLVDFSLELLGIAVVAVAVMACLGSSRRIGVRRRMHVGWGAGVAAICLVALAPEVVSGTPKVLAGRLAKLDQAGADSAFGALLSTGLKRHPQEPLIAYAAASWALDRQDRRAALLINRVMRLAPGWAGPHVLASRLLWRLGRHSQAIQELKMAMKDAPWASRRAACALAEQAPERVSEILPQGENRFVALQAASHCLPAGHRAWATLDPLLMAASADEQQAFVRTARRLFAAGRSDDAHSVLGLELANAPCKTHLVAERALRLAESGASQGRTDALDLTHAAIARCGRDQPLAATEAQLLGTMGRATEARAAWQRMRALANGDVQKLQLAYLTLGDVERRLGSPHRQLAAYVSAIRLSDDGIALREAARVAEQLGMVSQSLRWWRRACDKTPHDEATCAHVARLTRVPSGPRANE